MISTHLAVALILGAFLLGYLLVEWVYGKLLDRQNEKLADMADTIEDLVTKNDAAASELRQYKAIFGEDAVTSYAEMAARVQQLEALLQLVPEGS